MCSLAYQAGAVNTRNCVRCDFTLIVDWEGRQNQQISGLPATKCTAWHYSLPAASRVAVVQVARQTQEVLELLQAAQGFQQVTNAQRGIAARKVVNQVLHSLQRLGDVFGGVLAAEDAARSAGQVLQAVLQSVIGEFGA